MRIVEKFEPIVRTMEDTVKPLGLYDDYGTAYDEAILYATKELPKETTKVFEIHKVFVNEACFDYGQYERQLQIVTVNRGD